MKNNNFQINMIVKKLKILMVLSFQIGKKNQIRKIQNK